MPACAFLRASVGSTEYDGVASTHEAEHVVEEQVKRSHERDVCRHPHAGPSGAARGGEGIELEAISNTVKAVQFL